MIVWNLATSLHKVVMAISSAAAAAVTSPIVNLQAAQGQCGAQQELRWCRNGAVKTQRFLIAATHKWVKLEGVVKRPNTGVFVSAAVQKEEPLLLRVGVSIITEALRVLNFGSVRAAPLQVEVEEYAVPETQTMLESLRSDYQRAYFLTGEFTTALYAEDCLFADPTIQFTGRDKYQRNLKLLVPFFEDPSLSLFSIEEGSDLDERSMKACWRLRTYLRLPWKPLIEVDGSTVYDIDANSKTPRGPKGHNGLSCILDIGGQIVRHVESWSITGGQAIKQIFIPSSRAFWKTRDSY